MAQLADHPLNDLEPGETAELGYGQRCANCIKAYYVKVSVGCLVLAAIHVSYVYVYKALANLDAGSSEEWKQELLRSSPALHRTNQTNIATEQRNFGNIINMLPFGEFNLGYKKLYVFSRTKRIDEFRINSLNVNDGDGIEETVPSLNASDENGIEENVTSQNLGANASHENPACTSSGIPNSNMFDCSELLPSVYNVFFLETSCASGGQPKKPGDPTLSEKTACSIFSAAFHNPTRKVILLFTCPFPEGYNWTKDWKVLFNLQNFFFSLVNLTEFYADTPLLAFYHGPLAKSLYPAEHHADVLRLVVLYFYGGTYLDTDHITLRSLDDLGVNFISDHGPLKKTLLSNSGMNFEPNHPLMKACLREAFFAYVPKRWHTIGPLLLTSVVQSYCNVSGDLHLSKFTQMNCNIKILPKHIFYAVDWNEWTYFYQSHKWTYVKIKVHKSYGAHYWNHMGKPPALFIGTNQPIIMLAKRHCPPIYICAGAILS